MAKLALVFILFILTFNGIQSDKTNQNEATLAENENNQSNSQGEEDTEDSVGRSFASGHSQVGGFRPRPRPGPVPGPWPRPPTKPAPVLECFSCSGCPSPANATSKICPFSYDPDKQRKCVHYAEKFNDRKQPWIVRGCASERGTCAEIQQAHSHDVELLFCKECEGYKCNNSNGAGIPHSLPDLFMAFLALIVAPVIAKYTMS